MVPRSIIPSRHNHSLVRKCDHQPSTRDFFIDPRARRITVFLFASPSLLLCPRNEQHCFRHRGRTPRRSGLCFTGPNVAMFCLVPLCDALVGGFSFNTTRVGDCSCYTLCCGFRCKHASEAADTHIPAREREKRFCSNRSCE